MCQGLGRCAISSPPGCLPLRTDLPGRPYSSSLVLCLPPLCGVPPMPSPMQNVTEPTSRGSLVQTRHCDHCPCVTRATQFHETRGEKLSTVNRNGNGLCLLACSHACLPACLLPPVCLPACQPRPPESIAPALVGLGSTPCSETTSPSGRSDLVKKHRTTGASLLEGQVNPGCFGKSKGNSQFPVRVLEHYQLQV